MHAYSILYEQFYKIYSVQYEGIQHGLLKGSHLKKEISQSDCLHGQFDIDIKANAQLWYREEIWSVSHLFWHLKGRFQQNIPCLCNDFSTQSWDILRK